MYLIVLDLTARWSVGGTIRSLGTGSCTKDWKAECLCSALKVGCLESAWKVGCLESAWKE